MQSRSRDLYEQTRFISVARQSACTSEYFWRNNLNREVVCGECFVSENLFDRVNFSFISVHSITIYDFPVLTRCEVCSRNVSIINKASNCDQCWEALSNWWVYLSETEREETANFVEPVVIYIRVKRTGYSELVQSF